MGKLRFRLFHVMPHVWFYKLKEMGKTGKRSSLALRKSSYHRFALARAERVGPTQRACASPINYKAFDIQFPESPKRKASFHTQSVETAWKQKQKVACTVLDSSFSAGCTCRATVTSFRRAKEDSQGLSAIDTTGRLHRTDSSTRSVHLGCSKIQNMVQYTTPSGEKKHASASESKENWGNQICFDPRELERRLKTLGPGERNRCYRSPIFSATLPSPVLDVASQESHDVPDYSYRTSFEEDDGSAMQLAHDEGKLFECRSTNAPNHRLRESSIDNESDERKRLMGNKEICSLTSEARFLIAIDEVYAPLLRKPSGPRRKQAAEKKGLSSPTQLMVWLTETESEAHKSTTINSDRSRWKENAAKIQSSSVIGYNPSSAIANKSKKTTDPIKHSQLQPATQSSQSKREVKRSLTFVNCDGDVQEGHAHEARRPPEFSYLQLKKRPLSGRDPSYAESGEFDASKRGLDSLSRNGSRHRKLVQSRVGYDNFLRSESGQSNFQHCKTDVQPGDPPATEEIGRVSPKPLGRRPRPQNRISQCRSELRRRTTTGNAAEADWYKGTLRVVKEKRKESASQGIYSGIHSKVYESFAMVKCSYNPQKDFKDSMMEMILAKELHSSEDLEQLLQCYLSLNSEQYHHVIINVFKEVWSELFNRSSR